MGLEPLLCRASGIIDCGLLLEQFIILTRGFWLLQASPGLLLINRWLLQVSRGLLLTNTWFVVAGFTWFVVD